MDRDTAHWHITAFDLAPLGQRNIKGSGGINGITEEHFIEIPHAIKQQAIVMGRFNSQELRQHWRHP